MYAFISDDKAEAGVGLSTVGDGRNQQKLLRLQKDTSVPAKPGQQCSPVTTKQRVPERPRSVERLAGSIPPDQISDIDTPCESSGNVKGN